MTPVFDLEEKYSLRDTIGQYMKKLGGENEKVLVVNADLMGTCRNRSFVEAFPDRAFNVGIAEQNLVSFSAGLAHEGFIPFAFTMAPFMSMRACEQCRTDIAYPGLNVRLVAAYAGVSGGISGPTHWGIEDCGIMCSMPNMTVIEVSDPVQAEQVLSASLSYQGPIYIRNGIVPTFRIHGDDYQYRIGRADVIIDGDDGAIICSGTVVQYAVLASLEIRKTCKKQVRVIDMHTIKPIDRQAVIEAAGTGTVLVVQDHNVIGGLGSQVARVIAESGLSARFAIAGIPDTFAVMAHADYLYAEYGMDAAGIKGKILEMMEH